VQTSVHASARLDPGRRTTVGPVTVEVVAPMRTLRVVVGPNDAGLEADVTFSARTEALEEPRFTVRRGTRVVMDYTRLTQFGTWGGRVAVGDDVVALDGLDVLGSRDRSWGIRSVGEREAGAPGGVPQFFWLWAPLNLPDRCIHLDVQEDATGRRAHVNGDVVPLLDRPDAPVDLSSPLGVRTTDVSHEVVWRPGTRRADAARLTLVPHGSAPVVAELEPLLDFQMLGIGYLHPEWGHGTWKGEAAVGVEAWTLDELDPLLPQHLHVQQLVRVTVGDEVGPGCSSSSCSARTSRPASPAWPTARRERARPAGRGGGAGGGREVAAAPRRGRPRRRLCRRDRGRGARRRRHLGGPRERGPGRW
jgi:hypothetical protein